MGIIAKLISSILNKATIVYKAQLTPNTYHIRLQGEVLKQANYVPGYFIRIFVGKGKDLAFEDNIRSYSVWQLDKTAGTLDMAISVHSDGSGSAWAKECHVGDEVAFGWHKGNFIVDDTADDYLFIGDLSALGHLYEINRHLPKGKRTQSIIYDAHTADFFPDIDGTRPFTFYNCNGDQVLSKVPALISSFSANSITYIGGDSRVCVTIHNYLRRELKWDTRRIKAKPFWNPLKKGLE